MPTESMPFKVKGITPGVYTINKFGPTVTLRVKISTEFLIRKWIALRLIKLAVLVLGCGLEVEDVDYC